MESPRKKGGCRHLAIGILAGQNPLAQKHHDPQIHQFGIFGYAGQMPFPSDLTKMQAATRDRTGQRTEPQAAGTASLEDRPGIGAVLWWGDMGAHHDHSLTMPDLLRDRLP